MKKSEKGIQEFRSCRRSGGRMQEIEFSIQNTEDRIENSGVGKSVAGEVER
jgi:hypothetical protein